MFLYLIGRFTKRPYFADIEIKDNNDFTALSSAWAGGHDKCASLLLHRGAVMHSDLHTTLCLAAEAGSSIGGTRHIHFFCSLARSMARSAWL